MSTNPETGGIATDSTTPTDTIEWDGTNLAGDIVAVGIRKNKAEFHDDLFWFFRYAGEKNYSQTDSARVLGINGATYSKVLRGEYKNAEGLVLPPPSIMLSRIRVLRGQEKENVEKRSKGRVMTPTVREIHQVCQKTWHDGTIGFIFGESHVGKTYGLEWFRDENNHGATIYVDLQGVGGVQDIYRAFARALRISPNVSPMKLMPRVMQTIDRTNLVIIDEFHHITYAYQKGGAVKMVNALKAIKDKTGCAMVICSTNVGREEFDEKTGHEAKLLKQLWRRGTIKLQLPDALRVADVRAFATAYELDFPAAGKGGDTWKALRAAHPDFEGLNLCERIAYESGVKHLVCLFQDGNIKAGKKERELRWSDVISAQDNYDTLSAKKAV
jgi:DNA transposition AAA+ family ATPase